MSDILSYEALREIAALCFSNLVKKIKDWEIALDYRTWQKYMCNTGLDPE
jgi:hypothetical protein